MFAQGSFAIDPNMTPEQVARKRAAIAALLPRFGSAKFVGEGIGQLATGILAGRQGRKLDKVEGAGTASANSLFERLMGTANSAQSSDVGPLSMLGMKPEATGPAPTPREQNAPDAIAADAMFALGKINPNDREILAKTLMAEAGGEGYGGMLAAGAVIDNRRKGGGYGDGLEGVIMKPGQFSAWNGTTGYAGGEGGLNMDGMSPSEEAYAAADVILTGNYEDPTGGATHYYNPNVANPKWGQKAGGDWQTIGNHVFGFADAGRGGASGSVPQGDVTTRAAVPSAPQIPIAELQLALQNPWLSAEQKGLITSMIGEQQQASDPMRQMELEKARLELEAMKNPQPKQGFVQLTPDEVTSLGLPPGVYQRGPDGRIDTVEKTQGVSEDNRYQPVGGQIWDMKPEGGGPPQLVGGGSEEVIYGPDGNPIVTRGPAGSSKPFTEGQSKDVAYSTRAQGALDALEPIAGTLTDRGDVAAGWLPMGLGGGMQSPDYQVAKTAGDEFLQAILRKDTGAAITTDEQALYGETYLPKPGDGPERLAYKSEARKRAVEAIKAGMSPAQIIAQERALQTGGAAPAPAPTAPPEADGWQAMPNGVRIRVKQ